MNLSLLTTPQITLPSARQWFYDLCLANLPRPLLPVIEWADTFYRVMSKDAEFFDSTRSPWLIEPLQMADDPLISNITYVKPIQIGGTSLGEIMLMRWILGGNGLIHYNWPTNDKARDRWEKFTEKRLKACRPVRGIMPDLYEDCLIKFPNITFAMQGVFTTGNLDSDTVDYIINEEIHQWNAGMLGKAKGRQTRVTFPKCINISNGGLKGDQLHQEFNEGTQQQFETKCPGCGKFHIMRTRWEDSRPDLGGLRYDSDGCKRADGTFDYNKLVPTIRYQMPCGYELRDDIRERRSAALAGRYSDPFNTGALLTNRSYTLQAVACHDIRWLDLIMEKHQALRSLKAGDDTDFRRYMQEREAVFYDADAHRPYQGALEVTRRLLKNRAGMKDRLTRLAIADWQQGFKHLGELTHWWLLIIDVDHKLNRQIVFEGKIATDAELVLEIDAHEVKRSSCFLDASKNTKAILSFCYREGLNAVSGIQSHRGFFRHEDGTRRYYAMENPICTELNMPARYEQRYAKKGGEVILDHAPDEPVIISYNKAGLLKNHFFLRDMKANVLANVASAGPEDYIDLIVPGDISEEFKLHMDAWDRVKDKTKKTNDEVEGFCKKRREDHLMMCLAYSDMVLDWSGLLGDRLAQLGIKLDTPTAQPKE